jgi:predicted acyl esterase
MCTYPSSAPPYPVILIRTPYDKNALKPIGEDGARRGYAVVVQDTRGRFASEGANLPFEGDGWWENRADGVDTIGWIARQAWCNGKIGTWGGSALGINQLMLAGAGARPLTCQHITVAEPNLHQALFPGGVFKKSLVEDWLRATKHAPDALTHWTRHPAYDAFWQARDVNRRYRFVDAPAVHIGGYYDIFAQGTIDAFTGYQTRGGRNARGRQKLLMGPWAHGVLQKRVGELEFPNADQPPCTFHDPWRWFERYLKGVENGVDKEPTVVYYVMGAVGEPNAPGNEWRTADRWLPLPTRATPLYLQGDRTLAFRKPTSGAPLTYTYDPQNPAPTVGGRELSLPAGPRDQRRIESRPDVLVFTSAPLEKPLEVIGRVKAVLYVASDAPDTDFIVRLCDVYPERALLQHRRRRAAHALPRVAQPRAAHAGGAGLSRRGRPVDDGDRVQRGASAARACDLQQRAGLRPEPEHGRAVPRQRTRPTRPQHCLLRRAATQSPRAARCGAVMPRARERRFCSHPQPLRVALWGDGRAD